jgi:hypothetical protein
VGEKLQRIGIFEKGRKKRKGGRERIQTWKPMKRKPRAPTATFPTFLTA